jgi:hypothetical protein
MTTDHEHNPVEPSEDIHQTLLQHFAQAWSEHNLEAVMDCFAPDGWYSASYGPEPGQSFRGQAELRHGIATMWAYDAGSRSEVFDITIAGERGFWQWKYYFSDQTVAHGCDFFEFRGGKIQSKNAFRKVYPAPATAEATS